MTQRKRFIAKEFLKSIHKRDLARQMPPLAVFNLDVIGRHVVCDGFFEIKYLTCLRKYIFDKLDPNALCLDIGANIGNHSVFFASHFKQVKSFEPNPRTFKLLEANAMLCPEISAYNFGLSSKAGTVTATYGYENMGGASISLEGRGAFSTQFTLDVLDDVLDEDEKSSVGLIKVDVEGHELDVFKGATDTLSKSSPLILFEILPHEIENGNSPARALLQDHGYAYFYELVDTAPFASVSLALARLFNAFSVIFTGKKILENLVPRRCTELVDKKPYAMLIASKTDLAF